MMLYSAIQAIRARLEGLQTRPAQSSAQRMVEDVEAMDLGLSEAAEQARPDPKADARRKMQAALDAIGE